MEIEGKGQQQLNVHAAQLPPLPDCTYLESRVFAAASHAELHDART